MKSLSKIVLAYYLLVLLWLVLFKFSYEVFAVLSDHQTRSLNLIPFADGSRGSLREIIDNFVVFVPFGLLLSVNLKRASFWRKLTSILTFSLATEIIQFVFAIGRTDMTDVVMNTFGGFLGLALYSLASRYVDDKKLDRCIVIAGAILLIALTLFRVLFLKIRY